MGCTVLLSRATARLLLQLNSACSTLNSIQTADTAGSLPAGPAAVAAAPKQATERLPATAVAVASLLLPRLCVSTLLWQGGCCYQPMWLILAAQSHKHLSCIYIQRAVARLSNGCQPVQCALVLALWRASVWVPSKCCYVGKTMPAGCCQWVNQSLTTWIRPLKGFHSLHPALHAVCSSAAVVLIECCTAPPFV